LFRDDVEPCLLLPSFVVLTTFDFPAESEAAITCDSAPHRRVANGGIIHQRRSDASMRLRSRYAMMGEHLSFDFMAAGSTPSKLVIIACAKIIFGRRREADFGCVVFYYEKQHIADFPDDVRQSGL
jgi:hypothetical protein